MRGLWVRKEEDEDEGVHGRKVKGGSAVQVMHMAHPCTMTCIQSTAIALLQPFFYELVISCVLPANFAQIDVQLTQQLHPRTITGMSKL